MIGLVTLEKMTSKGLKKKINNTLMMMIVLCRSLGNSRKSMVYINLLNVASRLNRNSLSH